MHNRTIKRHPVHQVNDGVFNSNSGLIVDIINPTEDMICIEDIASALSKICRFGGQCNDFYSVAQHSVVVMAMAPEWLQREALMHDAAEAYLGDVIKPLKVILGENYKILEANFMRVIARKFNLSLERLAEVKQYDIKALTIEAKYFQEFGYDIEWHRVMQEININPSTWKHWEAQQKFLAFYKLLFEL